ncbi:MAG TPA: DNA adenine methylase, partial [Gemmatimonadaceae bacterium]|nr:DNA adenine methylase [Gemmatimonadaceae bacterium]
MRYIGNKTRLLDFIRRAVRTLGLRPGAAGPLVVHDAFAGTASVGRALKEDGWRVAASDVMTYSYVLQRAYVEASAVPSLAALHAGDADFRRACRSPALRARAAERGGGRLAVLAGYLATCDEPGFVTGHFSPAGGRMYFTEENARRIDGARARLHEWHRAGLLNDDAYYLLLASVIEGADRVANTAGVYAAYIKRWQPNALRTF